MDTNNPLVSIVMPTYNRADYILETIASIRAQTYTNWELLVLDDGSTDNTAQIIGTVADPRIIYTDCGRVGKTGKLKNMGIRAAKGDLIAFMDSDDLWPAQKLELQVNALLQYPEAGFSFTNGYNFKIDKHTPFEIFYPRQEGLEFSSVFIAYCTPTIGIRTPTILVWRKAIETAGYFKEDYLFNDFGFIGNLAYHFKSVLLFDLLLQRRMHPENSDNPNRPSIGNEYFETIRHYIKKDMLPASIGKHAMFITYINSGEGRLKYRKLTDALNCYIKAWMLKPLSIIPLKKMIKATLHMIRKKN